MSVFFAQEGSFEVRCNSTVIMVICITYIEISGDSPTFYDIDCIFIFSGPGLQRLL